MKGTDRDAWTQWATTRPAAVAIDNPRPNKYGAKSVRVDGIRFDSTREADRYHELKLLAIGGLIANLEIHPRYALLVGNLSDEGPPRVFTTIGYYSADFRYLDTSSGATVVEEIKSKPTKTEAYRLRKRHVEAQYGITITEIE